MSLRMLARRSVLALGVVVIAELGVFSAATRVAAQDGEPGADQADDHVRQALAGENAPAAVAKESEAVPAGEIHVHVLDEADAAVASAAVEVGTLGQGGKREKVEALTDSNGVAVFKGLPTGSVQAYRVNVPHQGAVYSRRRSSSRRTTATKSRCIGARCPPTRGSFSSSSCASTSSCAMAACGWWSSPSS
ncbi:MAG: hypothetical protein R3A78_03965 [Polyangiales bacterium]